MKEHRDVLERILQDLLVTRSVRHSFGSNNGNDTYRAAWLSVWRGKGQ